MRENSNDRIWEWVNDHTRNIPTTQELETKMEYEQEDNKIEKGTRDVHNCQANDYTSLY